MNILKIIPLTAFVLICQTAANAQAWTSFQSQQQINDLVDVDNQLLMATDAGLVVMDKNTLEKTILNKSNSNLSNNHIQSIARSASGDTWIGTYDVILGLYDGSGFTDIIAPDREEYDPESTELYDFEIAPNGDFWLATSDGIFHKQGQDWSFYDQEELGDSFFEAWDIAINDAGEVFVASFFTYKFENGTWTNISESTPLENYLDAEILISTSGDLYIAGDLDQIGRYNGESWQLYDIDLNGFEIEGIHEDQEGNIYFHTLYDGIFKLVDDSWVSQENEQIATFNNYTSYFYIDNQDNQWVNSGIYLSVNKNGNVDSTSISDYTIESNFIRNVHKGENGFLYFISGSTNNISSLSPSGEWSFLNVPEELMFFENFTDLLYLAEDNIWLSSTEGLHHYDGSTWIFTNLEACRRLAIDSQGKVYAQANNKIYIIENEVITEYNVNNSQLSPLIVSGLGIDPNDNLWIASFSYEGENAIQKVSTDGVWTTYDGEDFPEIDQAEGYFHFDNSGNVWIPTDLIGAIKFDGETWTNPIKDNLDEVSSYYIYSIASDTEGKIYFAHEKGLVTLQDEEWENFIIEELSDNSSSFRTNIEFDDEGILWWANDKEGLFSYTPESTTSSQSEFEAVTNFSIYPNPASDYSTLEITVREQANTRAQIFNSLGQIVATYNFGILPAGIHHQNIKIDQFPGGLYTIRLMIGNQVNTKTLMVR